MPTSVLLLSFSLSVLLFLIVFCSYLSFISLSLSTSVASFCHHLSGFPSALKQEMSKLHLLIGCSSTLVPLSHPSFFLFSVGAEQISFDTEWKGCSCQHFKKGREDLLSSPLLISPLLISPLLQMGTSIVNAHSATLVPISPLGVQNQSTGHHLKHSVSHFPYPKNTTKMQSSLFNKHSQDTWIKSSLKVLHAVHTHQQIINILILRH